MLVIIIYISLSAVVAPPDMVKTITEEEHDRIKGSKKGSISSQSSLSKRFLNADTMSLVIVYFADRKLFPFYYYHRKRRGQYQWIKVFHSEPEDFENFQMNVLINI